MIQLAIPIEPGNSGGPVLDLQGRVHGIVTMKSPVTANLGFAVPINALKPLLAEAQPGADGPLADHRPARPGRMEDAVRRRAGGSGPAASLVDGPGTGFGGRSLLPVEAGGARAAVRGRRHASSSTTKPARPAWSSTPTASDKHYGFYPTGGKLRLTRFDGPDVFSWKVLRPGPSRRTISPASGTRSRSASRRTSCSATSTTQLVFESTDRGAGRRARSAWPSSARRAAEFKSFQVGKTLPAAAADARPTIARARSASWLAGIPPSPSLVDKLAPDGAASLTVLRDRATQLEQQAAQLRQLALAVHHQRVLADLAKAAQGQGRRHRPAARRPADRPARQRRAGRGGLSRRKSTAWRAKVADALPKDADDKAKLAGAEQVPVRRSAAFTAAGATTTTAPTATSTRCIDDREGLPITLSVLYMELGRRLGLKVVGVPLPGHFVVRHEPAEGEGTADRRLRRRRAR